MPRNRTDGPHVLLITGMPGVGKTTAIRRVAERIEPGGLRGFCTDEIREGGERKGFRLASFDGATRVIAHVDFAKTCRIGKYGVDVEALDDSAGLLRPDPKAQVYLVDEIGKMECLSDKFVTAMRVLLSGRTPVVATVGARGSGFMTEVKSRTECEVWQITRANRDKLPARIVDWIAERR